MYGTKIVPFLGIGIQNTHHRITHCSSNVEPAYMFREPEKCSKQDPFKCPKQKLLATTKSYLLDCEIYRFKPTITLIIIIPFFIIIIIIIIIIPLRVWSLDLRLPVDDVQHIAV